MNHPDLGWQAFGGNLSVAGSIVTVTPLDSFRRRLYLAPVGLFLTLDAGEFESVDLDVTETSVHVRLAPANDHTPSARLRVAQPAKVGGIGTYAAQGSFATERGALVVPLGAGPADVILDPS